MQKRVFGKTGERRRTARRSNGARAILTFERGGTVVPCAVRDFSDIGAHVQLRRHVATPDRVYLIFPDHRRAYEADVSWRKDMALGLKFGRVIDLATDVSIDLRFLSWAAADARKTA
jgi:hypothetical protein